MIHLELVSPRTFKKVVDMKLGEPQNKYVAANVVSLAQAWLYYDETAPYAICDGEQVVGFVMLDVDENERTIGIWRFMIAPEHQRKGYGRETLKLIIELSRKSGKFDLVHLDYVLGNDAAKNLYYSVGFRENGEIEDGEIIMTYPLTDSPKVGMTAADEEDIDEIKQLTTDGIYPTGIEANELEQAILNEKVKRLTVFGKAVGFELDGVIYLAKDKADLLPDAVERVNLGFIKSTPDIL